MLSVEMHVGLIYKTILEGSFYFVFEIMFLIFATTLAIFFLHFLEAVDANML